MLCKIVKKELVVQQQTEDVYDISVEHYHNFILANGAVVHNCDSFQSAQLSQQLEADGYDCKLISVDRLDSETKTQLQYAYLKSTIYDRRLAVYKDCDFLTEEVLGLERLSDGHIDHPLNGSKDAIDAVCGALWNASLHADEYAYEYGESLDVLTEFNNNFDIHNDLENSMLNLYMTNRPTSEDNFVDFGFGKSEEFMLGVQDGLMLW